MKSEDIEKLIQLMQRYDLSELQIKNPDLEFMARRGDKFQPVVVHAPAQAPAAHAPAHSAGQAAPAAGAPAAGDKPLKEIPSPIVGTFYRAPSPDQAPFKEVGDHVSAEDVICIVEAMKVMNEIKAGVTGTIRKILVQNATPVEYGQPLFLVEAG